MNIDAPIAGIAVKAVRSVRALPFLHEHPVLRLIALFHGFRAALRATPRRRSLRWRHIAQAGLLSLSGALAPLLAPAASAQASEPPGAAPAAAPADAPADGATGARAERLIIVAVADAPESMVMHAGSTPRGYDLAPRYDTGSRAAALLAEVKKDYRLRSVSGWPITALNLYCALLQLPDDSEREAVLAALQQDKRITLAQPLQTFSTYAVGDDGRRNPTLLNAEPRGGGSDPYLSLQSGYNSSRAGAVQRYARGAGVRIAVIDTGVDRHHPDLAGRLEQVRNYVDQDWARFDSDRHGTEVAGLIAARAGNGLGIAGLAPEAELLVLKACWQLQADRDSAVCNSYTLAQALIHAADAGAEIINLSLGGPADPLLSRLLGYCLGKGILIVGAVPPDGSLQGFPLNVPGVLAAAMPGEDLRTLQVLRAPGRDVLTLTPGGHYDFVSGTSFSTAFVSAAAALLRGAPLHLASTRIPAVLADVQRAQGSEQPLDWCMALTMADAALHCSNP